MGVAVANLKKQKSSRRQHHKKSHKRVGSSDGVVAIRDLVGSCDAAGGATETRPANEAGLTGQDLLLFLSVVG